MNSALVQYIVDHEKTLQLATRATLLTRFDSNETAFLERKLTQLRAKVFETVYADLLAVKFLPLASDIAPDATNYVWEVIDTRGRAKIGLDAPRIDVIAGERSGKVRDISDSYGWQLDAMRTAQRLGQDLSGQKLNAAKRAIDEGIDEVLATGKRASVQQNGDYGMQGFINNPDVEALGVINPDNDPWTMPSVTGLKVVQDLNLIVNTQINDAMQTIQCDTLLLAPHEFGIANSTPYSDSSDKTALRWFLENNPYIKTVDQWHRLTGAGVGGKNRAVCYRRDPLVLEGVVPLAFESLPPQAEGFEFVVNCRGRCGGTKIYQPLGVRYADFTPS